MTFLPHAGHRHNRRAHQPVLAVTIRDANNHRLIAPVTADLLQQDVHQPTRPKSRRLHVVLRLNKQIALRNLGRGIPSRCRAGELILHHMNALTKQPTRHKFIDELVCGRIVCVECEDVLDEIRVIALGDPVDHRRERLFRAPEAGVQNRKNRLHLRANPS